MSDKVYDCIIIGSGISGLQCAHALIHQYGIGTENIIVLEAQDYIGGRVHQLSDFIKGIHVDVGAEFLHGSTTPITRFARDNNEPLKEIFAWAQGDGGPLPEAVHNGYGLYYIADDKGRKRLLRFDDNDTDFVRMNKTLWSIGDLSECDYSDDTSVYDYLVQLGFDDDMMRMAHAGFSNTLCSNCKDLSLKQTIKWLRGWHVECEEDGDYYFANSFKCVIDRLQVGVQIKTNSPVVLVQHSDRPEDLVALQTADGTTYSCRSLVVTASPYALQTHIEFQPALSTNIQEALQTVNMHEATKVIAKFSCRVWPKDLQGMIVSDAGMPVPEIWFRDVSHQVDYSTDEPCQAYAVGFATAEYSRRVNAMSNEEALAAFMKQLDDVFSLLEPRHMSADMSTGVADKSCCDLVRPSTAYLGGTVWQWSTESHPFIGGGYCSPKARTDAALISILAEPYKGHIFFAGECTQMPGATSHAALESGLRSAKQVARKHSGASL